MDEFASAIRRIPPVTRFLVASTCIVTIGSLLGLVSPRLVAYDELHVFQKLQLWRPISSFFMGPPGLGFLFSIFMLYRYSSDLEEGRFHNQTADYTFGLLCMSAVIILLNKPLGTPFFFEPLLSAIIYTWAQANKSSKVNLFGFFTLDAIWFPWALLALTLLQAGQGAAIISLTGIVAAHLHYYITIEYPRTNNNRTLLATPQFLKNLLGNQPPPTGFRVGQSGTGFAPSQRAATGQQGQPRREPQVDRGHNWGRGGQRLGS